MHVACSQRTMRTWFDQHEPVTAEPIIADYEEFLLEQLAAKPTIGYKLMMKVIRDAKGAIFREAPIRAWLAAHKGASPIPMAVAAASDSIVTPTMGQASSSSGAAMPLLDLSGLEQHADFLRRRLSEEPAITLVALRDRLIQTHGVSCLERTMQTWLERARAIAPKRAIKRGLSGLPTLENLEEHADYLRGLLADDATMGYWKLRGSIGFPRHRDHDAAVARSLSWEVPMGSNSRSYRRPPMLRCRRLAAIRRKTITRVEQPTCYDLHAIERVVRAVFAMTCTKCTMERFMQKPFNSMVDVSIGFSAKMNIPFF